MVVSTATSEHTLARMSERDGPLDRLPALLAEALEALRAGAGLRPLGLPPERLTFTAEERGLLDRLTRDTPDIVQSMAGDVADALRHATPAVQPLLSDARDVDGLLVALVDQVVDRELRGDDPWGADEPARRRLLDLLARHRVALVREAITTRLPPAGEA
jgi:hypothetical protein